MNENKYKIERTSRFKKDYKLIKKRGYDLTLLAEVIRILAKGEKLEEKYTDHPLKGSFVGLRECHVTADWLLVYEIDDDKLYLYLTRTGTHSDLLE
jgi:mRNA interferase YafQ